MNKPAEKRKSKGYYASVAKGSEIVIGAVTIRVASGNAALSITADGQPIQVSHGHKSRPERPPTAGE